MNIGIVSTWFERGAAYVSRQYRDVLREHHNVFIYARGGEEQARGDPEWDGPEVFWARRTFSLSSTHFSLREFRKWLMREKIDLVLFNEQRWWPPVWLCREMGVRTAAYIDYYTEETIPFFGAYDALLCNTKRHHEAFDWHPGCHYIPWGTDIELFCPREDDRSNRGTVFFHSAGMDPARKGTQNVLNALCQLPRSAELVIHSQVDLARALPDHRETIATLEAQGQLRVIQRTIPAPGLYHLGDVYVYPTELEGIGLSIAEAMACGLPAVVPDCPPMSEFVESGVSGELVPVHRLTARRDGYYWPKCQIQSSRLAEAMQRYLCSRETLEQQKKAARAWAVAHLDWGKNAKGLSKILGEVAPISAEQFAAARRAGERKVCMDRRRLFFLARMRHKWPRVDRTVQYIKDRMGRA